MYDLRLLESACKVDISYMRSAMSKIGAHLNLTNKQVKEGIKKMDARFIDIITPFHHMTKLQKILLKVVFEKTNYLLVRFVYPCTNVEQFC